MKVKSKRVYIVVGTIFLLAVCVSLYFDFSTRPVYARTAGSFHVVIDAGHGGGDVGASSRNGTSERDINLIISKFVGAELKARNIAVTYTRTDENSLANPLARNQKKSDMDERRKIIEKVQPNLVISIHLNSMPTKPAVRGLQTFYDKTSEVSKSYATIIQKQFNNGNLHTNRHAATGDYYILKCTAFPSVLIECGFLSNPSEEKLLRTRDYQRLLATNIAEAITDISVASRSPKPVTA